MISSYRELKVWQKGIELAENIYKLTNIAEGRYRGTRKDYLYFLRIAYGSGAELETQMELVKRLNYVKKEEAKIAVICLEEVMKMLNIMIRRLSTT